MTPEIPLARTAACSHVSRLTGVRGGVPFDGYLPIRTAPD
jgi:hypothetical protein